jgi:serine/threonine protein kinase
MSQRLLIVDDEELVLRGLVRRLSAEGYETRGVSDGYQALAELERLDFDLVVLDQQMPGLDGMALLARLRQDKGPLALPVIMLTGVTHTGRLVDALEAGANDYVTKPVEPAVLVARIRTQLRQRTLARGKSHSAGATAEPGQTIDGKYKLFEQIGKGGYGVVFKARHLVLERDVALKMLLPRHAERDEVRRRFVVEGLSACRVQHPHAVAVLDAGTTSEGIPYLTMELLEGPSLAAELDRTGPLDLARAAAIAVPVCDVLAAAHKSGVIHRDIKPTNVILARVGDTERVKVVDFGIAKLIGEERRAEPTTEESVPGTPEYVSPERLLGEPATPACDVYGLGVTLFEMLTGKLPFGEPAPHALAQAMRQVQTDPVSVSTYRPDLPAEVVRAVGRALARNPTERATLAELRAALVDATEAARTQ